MDATDIFRIRFHGRGGQGMKTASRILGTAFFRQGFYVQDAPRYGAERRGAPLFAYVRSSPSPIHERGIIQCPDLVVVADDTLVQVAAAGVLEGIIGKTVFLIQSGTPAEVWRQRLQRSNVMVVLPVVTQPAERGDLPFIGVRCAAGAASLLGVEQSQLLDAIREELQSMGEAVVTHNIAQAEEAYALTAEYRGIVAPSKPISASDYQKPHWINLPFEDARQATPVIHAAATSVEVRTGLWRTMRPVIDLQRCHRCWWVCSESCPDGAIAVKDNVPAIDYDHCKGCMICVAQCPSHAITAVSEQQAQTTTQKSPP